MGAISVVLPACNEEPMVEENLFDSRKPWGRPGSVMNCPGR